MVVSVGQMSRCEREAEAGTFAAHFCCGCLIRIPDVGELEEGQFQVELSSESKREVMGDLPGSERTENECGEFGRGEKDNS